MHDQLKASDEALYERNGVLNMLGRNLRVKRAPERWQDEVSKEYNVAITYEERVFDALVDDMEERRRASFRALHVLGLDVRDNHKEAELGAEHTVLLVEALQQAGADWEEQIEQIVETFQLSSGRVLTHAICYY
jgi:RNA polymerase II subunit A C-terminal domain phosphatase SSU72